MKRVFIIAGMNRPNEPCGGPGGVNYRIEMANKKYKMLDNVFYIYLDCIVCKNGVLLTQNEEENIYYKLMGLVEIWKDIFAFTDEDTFVFHDVQTAYFASKLGGVPQAKTILVYHGQGSLYNEYLFLHDESREMQSILDELTYAAMEWTERVGFPSVGAMNALIETQHGIKKLLDEKCVDILYNGCDCEISNCSNIDNISSEEWDKICSFEGDMKFITVSNLVSAKGVDRLPIFFAKLKKKFDFLWILIGSGPEQQLIEELLKYHSLEDSVLWINRKIPNEDILKVMMCTNFYIMYHRQSIFDFSTIEAMHMGNVPILSNVGGNKEMIVEDNGLLVDVDEICNITSFLSFLRINRYRQNKGEE